MRKFIASLMIIGLLFAGCAGSDPGQSDTGGSDAGQSDTGGSDGGQSDTGGSDTGGSDTGGSDTGASDSGSASADIETWLIEVGNDFPDSAKCVADAMQGYSVADFQASLEGEVNEAFESRLDVVYDECDAKLGITSEP